MKWVSNSLLGSLVMHLGLISLIIGSSYFKSSPRTLAPTIDVDLVEIDFTTLDQDLSKVKIAQVKSRTLVSPKTKREKLEETPDLKDENPALKLSSDLKKTKTSIDKNETVEKNINSKSEMGGSIDSKGQAKVKMSYEQYLIAYINRYKTYPRIAERLKQQGIVTPKLVISKDGKLKDIRIDKSSGFSSLDQGAINLIKSLAPFKPLPENIKSENQSKEDEYTIKIPIGYTLIGS